ncbi:MAG TPA: hypothetical protein VIH40_10425 [Xanthobacteraceae bacterium]
MFTTPRLIGIALCAALDFSVGSIVYLVKLPIYLDSIATILCALLVHPDRRQRSYARIGAAIRRRCRSRRVCAPLAGTAKKNRPEGEFRAVDRTAVHGGHARRSKSAHLLKAS